MGEENCRETISSEELFFFDRKPAALPMYEVFRKSVLAEIPEAGIEVGKTQVSFFIGHMFAAVSFTPVRKAKDRPDPFLTITFGLPRRVEMHVPDSSVRTDYRPGSMQLLNLVPAGGRIMS